MLTSIQAALTFIDLFLAYRRYPSLAFYVMRS